MTNISNTNFTTMTPQNNNCDPNNPTVFAKQYFIQVAAVPVQTDSNSNPLYLPIHESGRRRADFRHFM